MDEKKYLTIREASQYLGFTVSYTYKLVWQRKIPVYKPNNGHLLFSVKELEDFIQKGRRLTHDELSKRAETMLNSKRH